MSQTAITLAFEQHLADLQMGGQPVVPDEFVLAHVPGLDLTTPIDRAAGLPPAEQIVHRQPVDQRGKVNANGVAYSIIMDTRVGDFTFNAMYLVHKASGLVAMVVHKAAEDKLKNQGNNQPGNSLVKSMLMEYQGAAEATNTQVDAGTWQIDFSARLLGLDRDIQQQAHDHYGDAAFIADGFAVRPGQGVNEFIVAAGLGYIAGLRTELAAEQSIIVSQRPATLYADVYHAGTLLSDWHTQLEIKASSTPLTDYVDEAGYPHYVTPLAQLAANGAVTDLRGRGGLWWHEQRPQAHTKEQVGLDKLENWSWSHSYTDATGGAAKYASGKAVADAYNSLNSSKLNAANYTAADVLAKLKTVDGQGSGLDADTIDGLHAKDLAWAAHSHTELVAVDGRAVRPNTTGISVNTKAIRAFFTSLGGLNGEADIRYQDMLVLDTYHDSSGGSPNALTFDKKTDRIRHFRPAFGASTWGVGRELAYKDEVWHADNDGSDSGLDADLLDGRHGDYYRAWANLTGVPAGLGAAGQIAVFPTTTPPAGWLKANGAAISRTAYEALFAEIGTTFGAGDGTTTFNLPDLRGEFVRGWDDGRGVDVGRLLNSAQADELKAHSHQYSASGVYDRISAGAESERGVLNYTSNTTATGGAETRPRNIALLYCIKY